MRQEALREAYEALTQCFQLTLGESGETPWYTTAKTAGMQRKGLSMRALAKLDGGEAHGPSGDAPELRKIQRQAGRHHTGAGSAAGLGCGRLRSQMPAERNSPTSSDHSKGFVMLELSRFLIYVVQQVRRVALCVSLDLLMLILFSSTLTALNPPR